MRSHWGQTIKRSIYSDAQLRYDNGWSFCKHCQGRVTWVTTRAGKLMTAEGWVAKPSHLKASETARFDRAIHKAHFLTCPKRAPLDTVAHDPVQLDATGNVTSYGAECDPAQSEACRFDLWESGYTRVLDFQNSGAALAWMRQNGFYAGEFDSWQGPDGSWARPLEARHA